MERKNQNLELASKSSATNENKVVPRFSNCLLMSNDPIQCTSSEDIYSINRMAFGNKSYTNFHDFEHAGEVAPIKIVHGNEHDIRKRQEMSSMHLSELSKYKQELREYTNTTYDLEEQCVKINFELSEMQRNHENFVAKRNRPSGDAKSYSDSTDSEVSLQKKYAPIIHRGNSFMRVLPTKSQDNLNKSASQSHVQRKGLRHSTATSDLRRSQSSSKRKRCFNESKENNYPEDCIKSREKSIRDIYSTPKSFIDVRGANQQMPKNAPEVKTLHNTISNLQNEQDRFRTIIEHQQQNLQDYHTRCVKAQRIMRSQQIEIDKLNSNNRELETEMTAGIDKLRLKIDAKLRDVEQLPQLMRSAQTKNDRMAKENKLLNERIRTIQAEANQLKFKIEEIGRRKITTMARLKTAERDLKIFKNYNTALKHEKRKLHEELQKVREHMNSMDISSKRSMSRQREQTEKQRRELQKRVHELEMKLRSCQSSTTSLVKERDSLVAELQTQLNTLVHNFEVSQKHIRVLRRHIYSMAGGNTREAEARNRVLVETA